MDMSVTICHSQCHLSVIYRHLSFTQCHLSSCVGHAVETLPHKVVGCFPGCILGCIWVVFWVVFRVVFWVVFWVVSWVVLWVVFGLYRGLYSGWSALCRSSLFPCVAAGVAPPEMFSDRQQVLSSLRQHKPGLTFVCVRCYTSTHSSLRTCLWGSCFRSTKEKQKKVNFHLYVYQTAYSPPMKARRRKSLYGRTVLWQVQTSRHRLDGLTSCLPVLSVQVIVLSSTSLALDDRHTSHLLMWVNKWVFPLQWRK